jgi:hypothetical protein
VDDLLAAGVFPCTELVLCRIVRERAAVVKFSEKSGFGCICVFDEMHDGWRVSVKLGNGYGGEGPADASGEEMWGDATTKSRAGGFNSCLRVSRPEDFRTGPVQVAWWPGFAQFRVLHSSF